jgi:hypothetical protein
MSAKRDSGTVNALQDQARSDHDAVAERDYQPFIVEAVQGAARIAHAGERVQVVWLDI